MFLAGRTLSTLEEVAEAIRAAGGAAETPKVDALERISLFVEAGRSDLSPHATRGDAVSATVLYMSMSLDGFIAGPNAGSGNGLGDGGERLHEWSFKRPDARLRPGV